MKHFEYPIGKIETIDPDDEGFYQCLARNDYGESSINFYLTIPIQAMMNKGIKNAKCFPMDNNEIYVTFDQEDSSHKIQYFIATDSPRDFYVQLATEIKKGSSFKFKAKIVKPLKPFFLYMRNMVPTTGSMLVSTLSTPLTCASQGIEPKFVRPNRTGIFLRWDAPETSSNITGYTIQFLNNGTTNPVFFTDEVIVSYETWKSYISWKDVENFLEKVKVQNSNYSEYNEIRVPGNVTGLYIVNTNEVYVRILGSTLDDGKLFDQDLSHLNWTNIKTTNVVLEPLTVIDIKSRSAVISWKGLDNVKCARICSLFQGVFLIVPAERLNCVEM